MEANDRIVKMKTLFLLSLLVLSASGRIHRLRLEADSRKEITLSTFGFLTGGTLAINITSFTMVLPSKINPDAANFTLFGFTLDKSKSPGFSSYMEDLQSSCILNKPTFTSQKEEVESVFFSFDFKENKVKIDRVGKDMQKLVVSADPRDKFLERHNLIRRAVVTDSALSDSSIVGGPLNKVHTARRKRADPPPPQPASAKNDNDQDKTNDTNSLTSTSSQASPSPSVATGTGGKNAVDSTAGAASSSDQDKSSASDDDAVVNKDAEITFVELSHKKEGVFNTSFLVYIQRPEEEGLYNLFFHNCLSYPKYQGAEISMTMTITEDNNGNFLTAGEMPVPALYFTFSVLFFIAGVAWLSVLRRSQQDVYKIHYLMLVVVFIKSLACMFHGVNMYVIQMTGIHEEAWAILWYIVYLMRGALMFVTVLLIGAGWAFIKHVLTDREKKLFLIIIPLQILDRVAEVIVEESEEGNRSYMTWKEIFILVDLLCCGAILFPVVWSIRHLQEASRTDGKAAINLQKLKLFRHFYILVVCYIYFTRIIVYLMKITLPFKLEWLTDLFTELAMMVFFVVTGAKFRPATDNPYLQVPLDSDDEDIEMEEVLTKTGSTENVVRVNVKTEGAASTLMKQRESSHEYD